MNWHHYVAPCWFGVKGLQGGANTRPAGTQTQALGSHNQLNQSVEGAIGTRDGDNSLCWSLSGPGPLRAGPLA